jgi:hypothetical protein
MEFRYPIQTEEAVVTVHFPRPRAQLEDVIRALQEALDGERARLRVGETGSDGSGPVRPEIEQLPANLGSSEDGNIAGQR